MDGIRPGGDVRQDGPNLLRQVRGPSWAEKRAARGGALLGRAELMQVWAFCTVKQAACRFFFPLLGQSSTMHSDKVQVLFSEECIDSLFISIQFEPTGELF